MRSDDPGRLTWRGAPEKWQRVESTAAESPVLDARRRISTGTMRIARFDARTSFRVTGKQDSEVDLVFRNCVNQIGPVTGFEVVWGLHDGLPIKMDVVRHRGCRQSITVEFGMSLYSGRPVFMLNIVRNCCGGQGVAEARCLTRGMGAAG